MNEKEKFTPGAETWSEKIAKLASNLESASGSEITQYESELKSVLGELSNRYYESLIDYKKFIEEESIPVDLLIGKYEELLFSYLSPEERKLAEENIRAKPTNLSEIEKIPDNFLGISGSKSGPGLIFKRDEQGKFVHRCYFGAPPIEEQTAQDVYEKAKWEFDDTIVFVNTEVSPWSKVNTWILFHMGRRRLKEETEIIGEDVTPKQLLKAVPLVKNIFGNKDTWRWVTKMVGYKNHITGVLRFLTHSSEKNDQLCGDLEISIISAQPSEYFSEYYNLPDWENEESQRDQELKEILLKQQFKRISKSSIEKSATFPPSHIVLFSKRLPECDCFLTIYDSHLH